MTFNFTEKSKVKMKMVDYSEKIINESPTNISKIDTVLTPAGNNIFEKATEKG